jgi:hypothetical protein
LQDRGRLRRDDRLGRAVLVAGVQRRGHARQRQPAGYSLEGLHRQVEVPLRQSALLGSAGVASGGLGNQRLEHDRFQVARNGGVVDLRPDDLEALRRRLGELK